MPKSQHSRVMHSSEEPNWRTPPALCGTLDREFRFTWDLAADEASALCTNYLGPGSPHGTDALDVDWWTFLGSDQAGFLNPPYSRTLASAYATGKLRGAPHPIDPVKARALLIESWAAKCWYESRQGCTVVAVMPFAPQTDWYRQYVYGHIWDEGQPAEDAPADGFWGWSGHAAMEERRLPHRINFLRPDGTSADSAGVNHAIIVWKPNPGYIGPWQPAVRYWSYERS